VNGVLGERKPMREFLRIQAFVFCCFLGGLAGAALSVATLGKWALEQYRADHPGEYVCGLFIIPYLFLGFLTGGAVGAVAGWRVQRRLAGPRT
jgi:hypothetical protein